MQAVAHADCESSFAQLHASTHKQLLKVVRPFVADTADAEDILQEVYANAWKHRSSYDPDKGSALSWLLSMAYRRAVDSLRRRKSLGRRVEVVNRMPHYDWVTQSSDLDPFVSATNVERDRAVQACLDKLPSRRRLVLRLTYFSELTHSEISTLCNFPLGTVKSWIKRSLAEFRTTMAEH